MSKKHSKNRKKGKNALKNNVQLPLKRVKQNHPSISACMIVKNEEEFLENCLRSIAAYVDEIIIVDTGSTDNTVEIAKRFTDRVYSHPWENSFGKARNQALQYSSGDWIFQIDADEELIAVSGERMLMAVREANDADVIYVNLLCSYAKGTKKSLNKYERIFKNNGIIHYEGNIHEQVVGGTKAFYSCIELLHHGYDVNEEKALKKFERTTGLLKKEIEKDPENPVYHHFISASYYSRRMFEEAADEAVTAVVLSCSKNDVRTLFAWSYYIAAMSFYYLKRLADADKYAREALDKYPEHVDSYYVLTLVALDEDRWDDVIRSGVTFLEKLEHIRTSNKGKNILINTMNEATTVNIMIGNAYYEKGSLREMEEYYKKAHDIASEKWRTWLDIGIYHIDKSGDIELARRFLDLASGEAPEELDLWYMRAKLNKKQGLIKAEIECLKKIINIGTEDPFIYNRLLTLLIDEGILDIAMDIIQNYGPKFILNGTILCKLAVLQLEKGQAESAIKSYMTALEMNPGLFEAWASLGEIMLAMNKIADSRTFFEKALTLKNNDIGTILKLCDISSREGDIHSVVKYTDLLLKELNLPIDRMLNNLIDLKAILDEVKSRLKDNEYYQNQISAISARISQIQDQPTN
ncbi:MAG: glycosyltransferase [Deltaproteobacteria bacterium]|nr:glycosyltransferase [Deltaproteobacteria bacterium]